MMNNGELLPCPFCGGEAHAYKNNLWHVACEKAHNRCVTMSAFVTEAEAIAAWNTRTHGTLTAEQVHDAIFNGSSYASFDGAKYYADGISMQAIADQLNATLGGEREKRLEKLVASYGEIANYFCERFACCDEEFANCKYCIGLPQGGQCELGRCNDESKTLGIEQPDYGGGECEPVNLEELYDRVSELKELVRDMWFWGYEGHMDSKSQDWQMKHIDGVLDRMKALGIEVET